MPIKTVAKKQQSFCFFLQSVLILETENAIMKKDWSSSKRGKHYAKGF
jgi:hypothetical protein